jgi:tetratricopeptide (TPR) repeat protein
MRPARVAALAAMSLAALAPAGVAVAFANVEVGQKVDDAVLPGLDGASGHVLGRARVNVFVFFRPGQEHSLDALRRMARLEREFEGRPVRWVAIVSDDYAVEEVQAMVRETGILMPVLVDRGNQYYGKLGVRLHPVVGIADQAHALAAYEHFRKINMEERLRARIRRALGEISDSDVEQVLEPARAEEGGDALAARRQLNLARALLKVSSWARALEAARKACEKDPGLAAARAVAGQALAAQRRCAEALAEFDAALRLDPREPTALAGREACGR